MQDDTATSRHPLSRCRRWEVMQQALLLLIVLGSGAVTTLLAQTAQPETVTVTLVRWPYT